MHNKSSHWWSIIFFSLAKKYCLLIGLIILSSHWAYKCSHFYHWTELTTMGGGGKFQDQVNIGYIYQYKIQVKKVAQQLRKYIHRSGPTTRFLVAQQLESCLTCRVLFFVLVMVLFWSWSWNFPPHPPHSCNFCPMRQMTAVVCPMRRQNY